MIDLNTLLVDVIKKKMSGNTHHDYSNLMNLLHTLAESKFFFGDVNISELAVKWKEVDDFCLSGPEDRHYTADRNRGKPALSLPSSRPHSAVFSPSFPRFLSGSCAAWDGMERQGEPG